MQSPYTEKYIFKGEEEGITTRARTNVAASTVAYCGHFEAGPLPAR